MLAATFLVHEAVHALAGGALGYPMRLNFNSASPQTGLYRSAFDAALVIAAGPAATVAAALMAFLFWRRREFGFLLVTAAFVMRLFASAVSIGKPNDEMRLGIHLGLHPWLLPLAVTALLGALTVFAARGRGIGWREGLVLYVAAALVVTALVMLDARSPGLLLFG